MFWGLALALLCALIFGRLAKQVGVLPFLGEIVAGILLGPSLLNHLGGPAFQEFYHTTFQFGLLKELAKVGMVFFLFCAGMEIDRVLVKKQFRQIAAISLSGIVFPFMITVALVMSFKEFFASHSTFSIGVLACFLGVALSITALPVIIRILNDLKLQSTRYGTIVIAAAIIDDLLGWNIFSALLLAAKSDSAVLLPTFAKTALMSSVFLCVMLILVPKVLAKVGQRFASPLGDVRLALPVLILAACVGSASSENLGIHSSFGALLAGVVVGEMSHISDEAKRTFETIVSSFFSPLLFVSVGIGIDFAANFNPLLTFVVIAVASVGKILGCGFAARWTGLDWKTSMSIGYGMNARGAMEILIAVLALES